MYSKQAIERYKKEHERQWQIKYPASYKDGHYFFNLGSKKPSAKLTDMVCNYLEWMGHEANRIDTKGTAVIDKKAKPKFDVVSGGLTFQSAVKFIPTKTKTGTEDVSVRLIHHKHPYGVPWAIEIKIDDRQSEKQIEREQELKRKGLWYDVVKTMDIFFDLYDSKINLLDG